MLPSNKKLEVKTSTLPGAGHGLFAKKDFAKGETIVEYTGRRTTWAAVEAEVNNVYIYHMNDDVVIDASRRLASFGRYANDAAGLTRVKGITNNAEYIEHGGRVYIVAKKNIPAGTEILVGYGPLYWKQIRDNIRIDRQQQKLAAKKAKG